MNKDRKSDTPYLDTMLKYREQMEVVLREGKTIASLRNGEAFKMVPQHIKKVLTISDTLGHWVGLPENELVNLDKTAALHDADKRLEVRPDEFTEEEKLNLEKALTKAGLDKELLKVTKEKFIDENYDKVDILTLPQMILYYADMLVSWNNIVNFEERIDESKTRRPELSESFFERELEFGKKIEARIFSALPEDIKTQIGKPEQIPDFLKLTLEQK